MSEQQGDEMTTRETLPEGWRYSEPSTRLAPGGPARIIADAIEDACGTVRNLERAMALLLGGSDGQTQEELIAELRADLALEAGGDAPDDWAGGGESFWSARDGYTLEVERRSPGVVEWSVHREPKPFGRPVCTDDGTCTTLGEAMRHAVESYDVEGRTPTADVERPPC